MTRPVELTRDEAEMLVDLCENTIDKRLHWLAENLRKQWGMSPMEGKPASLAYLGIHEYVSGEQDAKDAARYRWLRENNPLFEFGWYRDNMGNDWEGWDTLDRLIDQKLAQHDDIKEGNGI